MRFIISLSIVLIAFDATKIRRIKRALVVEDQKYGIHCVNKLEIANLCPYLIVTSLMSA